MTYQLYPEFYEAGFDEAVSPELDEFFVGAKDVIVNQDRTIEAEQFFAARDMYMSELEIHPSTVLSLCSDSGDIVVYFDDDTIMFFDSEPIDGEGSLFVDSTRTEHAAPHSFERQVMFSADQDSEPQNKQLLEAPLTIDEHAVLQAVLAIQAMRTNAKQRGIEINTHGAQLLKGDRERLPLRSSTQLERHLADVKTARENENDETFVAVGALASNESIAA